MDWHKSGTFEEFQALPTIFIHGVWTTRNLAIFQDIYLSARYMATKGMALLNSFPQVVEIDRPRHISMEEIDHVRCWSYFDGASQNNVGGASGILYLDEHHWLKYVVGLGNISNNKAKILSLKMLIMVARDKGVQNLQILGDSKLIIDWFRLKRPPKNSFLRLIYDEITHLLSLFSHINFVHIYQERNHVVDALSKMGLHLTEGTWK
jgi:ribonuclease HI